MRSSFLRLLFFIWAFFAYWFILEVGYLKAFLTGKPELLIAYPVYLLMALGLTVLSLLCSFENKQKQIRIGLILASFTLFAVIWVEKRLLALFSVPRWQTLLVLTSFSFLCLLGLFILNRFIENRKFKSIWLFSWALTLPIALIIWNKNILFERFEFQYWTNYLFLSSGFLVLFFCLAALLSYIKTKVNIKIRESLLWLVIVISVFPFGLSLAKNFRSFLPEKEEKKANLNRPNLILITIDTLRADHLHCYNPEFVPTPNIDSLANDSIIFKNALSSSNWTMPSVATMFTGLYPRQHGAGRMLDEVPLNFLGMFSDVTTFTQKLKSAGYNTYAFVDNPWLGGAFGFDKGFDYYLLFAPKFLKSDYIGTLLIKHFYQLYTKKGILPDGEWLNRRVLKKLNIIRKNSPFFLWVHFFDPHLPYKGHKEYPINIKPRKQIQSLINEAFSAPKIRAGVFQFSDLDREFFHQRHIGEVVYIDLVVGKLLDQLKELALYKDSLIILTSDHGEEFWEHNSFEHAHSFYQELLHIPLLVKLPKNKNAKKVVEAYVSLSQLYPTFLKLAGLKAESPIGVSDLESCALEQKKCPQTWMAEFTIYLDLLGAIGDQNSNKLILFQNEQKNLAFNLKNDPKELNPLDTKTPAFLSLNNKFKALKAGFEPSEYKTRMDEETKERLKALGYIR